MRTNRQPIRPSSTSPKPPTESEARALAEQQIDFLNSRPPKAHGITKIRFDCAGIGVILEERADNFFPAPDNKSTVILFGRKFIVESKRYDFDEGSILVSMSLANGEL